MAGKKQKLKTSYRKVVDRTVQERKMGGSRASTIVFMGLLGHRGHHHRNNGGDEKKCVEM